MPSAHHALELHEIDRLERSGERRINGGVALAILGGAGLIGGGLLLHRGVTAESDESDDPFETLGDDLGAGFDTALGAMIISAAIPVTIASIYLIGSGKSRHNEADRRREALRFAPSVGQNGVGAVVGGSF